MRMHTITRLLELIAPIYDLIITLLLRGDKAYRKKLIEFANLKGKETILDIGCGTGELEKYLSEIITCDRIYAIDISEKMIERARKKFRGKECIPNFLTYDAKRIPFPDSYFDVVFSSMVLHHFADDEKLTVLEEIKRVLKPNGIYVSAEFSSRKNPIVWLVSYNGILKEGHLKQMGFEIIETEKYKLSIMLRKVIKARNGTKN